MVELVAVSPLRSETRTQDPKLHKVLWVVDDLTPKNFVVLVLTAVFDLSEEQASLRVLTARFGGKHLVAAFSKEAAEAKAAQAIRMGCQKGYPLLFVTRAA